MTSFAERMANELNPDGVLNLVDAFERTCAERSEKPAFACLGHTLSFAEFSDLTVRFSRYLVDQLHLKPGDRIAVQLPNITQYPIAVWGAWRAGLIVVNTNLCIPPEK